MKMSTAGPLALCLSTLAIQGCSENPMPAGPSVTVSAPNPVSPGGGVQVGSQPGLTVSNATSSDGSSLTYSFQVASDSAFASIVARAEGIAQGAGGQTTWEVSSPLANGRFFWRARARAGSVDGPFSPVSEFAVLEAFRSTTPRDGLLVYDPLVNGSSVGVVGGGEFTTKGWRVDARSNSIIYDVPTTASGFLEVDITNLSLRNISADSRMVFIMWDPTAGEFTTNPYRVSVQKLDRRSSVTIKYIRLRWISNGRQFDDANSFIGWDPATTYHWRMEWGPEDGGPNAAKVFLDDREIMRVQYGAQTYRPNLHRIELGAAPRAESLEDAIFSNLRIGVRQ